jgi:hypothetical protein
MREGKVESIKIKQLDFGNLWPAVYGPCLMAGQGDRGKFGEDTNSLDSLWDFGIFGNMVFLGI